MYTIADRQIPSTVKRISSVDQYGVQLSLGGLAYVFISSFLLYGFRI
jgi:hypothetical protein